MAHYETGMYLCRVEDQYFSETVNGTEFFGLVIRPIAVIEGDQRHTISGEYTRKTSLWLNSEKNVESSADRLAALCPEWDGSWASLDPKTDGGLSLKGMELELRCSHSQSGDKVYDNFDFPRTFEADNYSSDSDIAKKLDRLYGTVRKKPATTSKVEVSEEEVPF